MSHPRALELDRRAMCRQSFGYLLSFFFSFKSSLGIGWLHWGKNGSHPIASTNLNGTFVHGFKSFVKSIHMH